MNHTYGILAIVIASGIVLADTTAIETHASSVKSPQVSEHAAQRAFQAVLGISTNNLSFESPDLAVNSAQERQGIQVLKLDRKDYRAEETIVVTVNNPDQEDFTTQIVDSEGLEAKVTIQEIRSGPITEVSIIPGNQFKPGKYTLTITDKEGLANQQQFS